VDFLVNRSQIGKNSVGFCPVSIDHFLGRRVRRKRNQWTLGVDF
jgi:hypothetical protein